MFSSSKSKSTYIEKMIDQSCSLCSNTNLEFDLVQVTYSLKIISLVIIILKAERRITMVTLHVTGNANCSTIQLVLALKPLHDQFKIKRVVTSTYQSVSGGGKNHMIELEEHQQQNRLN